ncbi:MAG: lysine--tRNA ligase [bacterium]|nr:lysine--tRNA ligase [bacterium]
MRNERPIQDGGVGELVARDYQARLARAVLLEQAGINPYPAEAPTITHLTSQLLKEFVSLEGQTVSIAGRMVSKRVHGGITFGHVEDQSGQIQSVFAQSRLGKDHYTLIRDAFDPGDFVGVTGVLGKTNTGEVSVFAKETHMLTKALRQPPEQVQDAEVQQRQRYLHTLVERKARERFVVRSQIVQYMREYFLNTLGCLEVETPILDSTYGGALARPFVTHHQALGTDFFLRIANELYLKRMTVGGYYGGVFEFARDFRNEGMDRTHNPEFTQLELYKPFWDYKRMMEMAENLMSSIVGRIHGTMKIQYGSHTIDFTPPWRRLSIYDGIREKLDIEPTTISEETLRRFAHEYDVEFTNRGETLLKLFEKLWEEELIQPTFICDYPAETSSLAKRHRDDPTLTERFELFVGGMETMNAYSELNDPRDQRQRFEHEQQKRLAGDRETMEFDEDFILSQEYGMPLQAGIGIGIDRWVMLLTNTTHIRQVIYFPTLRPKSR